MSEGVKELRFKDFLCVKKRLISQTFLSYLVSTGI
mgnify:CR=1 FL=1